MPRWLTHTTRPAALSGRASHSDPLSASVQRGSLELDPVESVLLGILVDLVRTDKLFQVPLGHTLSVKHLEEFLELGCISVTRYGPPTFLDMVSELNEDNLLGSLRLGEVCEREEGRLGEALESDVSKPDVERSRCLVEDAGEAPAALATIEADSGVELELLAVLHVEHLHHSLAEV